MLKVCKICSNDTDKLEFSYCTKCKNKICNTCETKVEFCPFCRSYDTWTGLNKVKNINEKTFRKLSIISLNISKLEPLTEICNCKMDKSFQCKHIRCKCIKHNKKYLTKRYKECLDIFNEISQLKDKTLIFNSGLTLFNSDLTLFKNIISNFQQFSIEFDDDKYKKFNLYITEESIF